MNVLIIDDHALIREGIALMVKTIQPDAGVWMENNCAFGMKLAACQKFDFVFLDLQLPDQLGFIALERFKERHTMTPVVVISAQEDRATVMRAIEMGAKAFVPKSADTEKMRAALKALLDGCVYLHESVLQAEFTAHSARETTVQGWEEWNLTERQKEVLSLVIIGLPDKMIARRLNIVESTVKIHVSAILKELKVASRTQALVVVARQAVKLPL